MDDLNQGLPFCGRLERFEPFEPPEGEHVTRFDRELYRCVALGSLRNHGKPQGSEITVKSERRHVVKERGYNYK